MNINMVSGCWMHGWLVLNLLIPLSVSLGSDVLSGIHKVHHRSLSSMVWARYKSLPALSRRDFKMTTIIVFIHSIYLQCGCFFIQMNHSI
jgi:hypothetical protein